MNNKFKKNYYFNKILLFIRRIAYARHKDVSLIICSYNTPEVLALCLKSFVYHHGKGPHKIIIIENSTNSETKNFLDLNNIPYLRNFGGTHSPSVDIALGMVKTKYALLIDSDVVFKRSIASVLAFFKKSNYTAMGEVQGDRGGFLLYPRIAPYFCLINIEIIRAHGIRFHDEAKIRKTNSTGFFNNLPLNNENRNQRFYDVGSSFLEEINEKKLMVKDFNANKNIVFHAESLSWAPDSGIKPFIEMGKSREDQFYTAGSYYKDVNVKNCFYYA